MAKRRALRDPLYGGDTRPAAPGGVPLALAIGLMILFFAGAAALMFAGLPGSGIVLLVFYLPAWGVLRWWVDGDLRKTEVVAGFLLGAGRTPLPMLFRFGGSTLSPLADAPQDFGMPDRG